MDKKLILSKTDHTLLRPDAKFSQIKKLCDEAIKWNMASACIPPAHVRAAREYVKNNLKICTVIGFPNGYSTTDAKDFEAYGALKDGADEIDMVINIGWAKEKKYDAVSDEIKKIKKTCGDKILKAIIESCLLTYEEKIEICKAVTESGADFIKTSTGFSTSGASFDDVGLMRKYCGKNVKIKAAGGIATFEDAEKFINLGADRIGSSRLAGEKAAEPNT